MPQLTTATGKRFSVKSDQSAYINARSVLMFFFENLEQTVTALQEKNPNTVLGFFQQNITARKDLPEHINGRALNQGEYSEQFLLEQYQKNHYDKFDLAFNCLIVSVLETSSFAEADALTLEEKIDLSVKIKDFLNSLQPATPHRNTNKRS